MGNTSYSLHTHCKSFLKLSRFDLKPACLLLFSVYLMPRKSSVNNHTTTTMARYNITMDRILHDATIQHIKDNYRRGTTFSGLLADLVDEDIQAHAATPSGRASSREARYKEAQASKKHGAVSTTRVVRK